MAETSTLQSALDRMDPSIKVWFSHHSFDELKLLVEELSDEGDDITELLPTINEFSKIESEIRSFDEIYNAEFPDLSKHLQITHTKR